MILDTLRLKGKYRSRSINNKAQNTPAHLSSPALRLAPPILVVVPSGSRCIHHHRIAVESRGLFLVHRLSLVIEAIAAILHIRFGSSILPFTISLCPHVAVVVLVGVGRSSGLENHGEQASISLYRKLACKSSTSLFC